MDDGPTDQSDAPPRFRGGELDGVALRDDPVGGEDVRCHRAEERGRLRHGHGRHPAHGPDGGGGAVPREAEAIAQVAGVKMDPFVDVV
jgi:hypothetical protein